MGNLFSKNYHGKINGMKKFWVIRKKYNLNRKYIYNDLIVGRSVRTWMLIPICYNPVLVNRKGDKIHNGFFTSEVASLRIGIVCL